MFPFDRPENIRKHLVVWCFQGGQKGTLGMKGLKDVTLDDVYQIGWIRSSSSFCGRATLYFDRLHDYSLTDPLYFNSWTQELFFCRVTFV